MLQRSNYIPGDGCVRAPYRRGRVPKWFMQAIVKMASFVNWWVHLGIHKHFEQVRLEVIFRYPDLCNVIFRFQLSQFYRWIIFHSISRATDLCYDGSPLCFPIMISLMFCFVKEYEFDLSQIIS